MNIFQKMKKLKSFNLGFIVKNILIVFLGTLLFLTFQAPFEKLVEATLVRFLFSHIEKVWHNDILFFVIIGLLLFITIFNFRKLSYNSSYIGLSVLIVIVFCLYRFEIISESQWNFKPLNYVEWLNYADIIIFPIIHYWISFFGYKKQKQTQSEFYDDRPLFEDHKYEDDTKDIDLLGYSSYAETLSKKIHNSHFEKSFAIGINGKWGYGKTSFINLLKKNLKGEGIIEIDFNPWYSQNPKAIIEDFFDAFMDKFPQAPFSLSRLIKKYTIKLADIKGDFITESIARVTSLFTADKPVITLYNEINDVLKKGEKKLIVYIDDLDRLDNEEIFEVIKLIRNTANFYNTFYIVSYDRDYLIKALQNKNIHRTEFFLEKIFQVEVTLPAFKKEVLREQLAKKLKTKLPENTHKEIEDIVIGSLRTGVPEYLNEWLENLRDVTRVVNSFVLNYSKLIGNVVFSELLRMELLRIKYPSVYNLIFEETNKFLVKSDDAYSFREFRYEMKQYNAAFDIDNLKNNADKSIPYLQHYLEINSDKAGVSKNDIKKIISLLSGVFPQKQDRAIGLWSHLSIVYPRNFLRYSAFRLFDDELCENEFFDAKNAEQKYFHEKIKEWVKQGKENHIRDKFIETKDFDSRKDFEKVIEAIFYFANLASVLRKDYNDIVDYDYLDLSNKLHYPIKQSKINFYDDENDLKTFIKNQLKYRDIPDFKFQCEFVGYINNENPDTFILDIKDLQDISIEYLEKNCEKLEKLDSNLWHLYSFCKQIPRNPENHGNCKEIVPEKAKSVFKNFILKKGVDGFVYDIIEFTLGMKKFKISNKAAEIFGSWQDFENELRQLKSENYKYLEEFLDFFEKFKASGYPEKKYISYTFKDIPVSKKYGYN